MLSSLYINILVRDIRYPYGVTNLKTCRFISSCSRLNQRLVTPDIYELPNFLKKVESKWKRKLEARFERERFASANDGGKYKYILSMFPYPSGRLHLGHVRIYTSGDILARYSKLLRRNESHSEDFAHVVNPMGFDSFGLPAENAANERGLDPAQWTNSNIRVMKQQLDHLAFQFDWREATSNPSFYKWTQKLFLDMFDAGLVYKSFSQVNWDPVDKTVLADEQVSDEGLSWRSGAKVEKRDCRQWFIKVNAFTDEIYKAEDIDPESWQDILTIQRNWIGKPCGWLFYLPVPIPGEKCSDDVLPVFTKNPELFLSRNACLTIHEDHWLEKIFKISEKQYFINPFTAQTIKVTISKNLEELPANTKATITSTNYQGDEQSELTDSVSRDQVILQAKLRGLGGYYTSQTYRDWLISRQRFWGTPIPIIKCKNCKYQAVPTDSLPVMLPSVRNLSQDTKQQDHDIQDDFELITPISRLAPPAWRITDCPSCGSQAKRECETFDTLVDSSWYFLRYATDPPKDRAFDNDNVQPVECYIGGKEHASMHLFYARFVTHFLHSKGHIKFREPFKKLLVQGMVKSRTYSINGKYLTESEYESLDSKDKVLVEFEKMSKSKGNGVDPQELLDTYGIDATRFCLMSYANPRSERLWRNQKEEFKDVLNFLRRVLMTIQEYIETGDSLRSNAKSLHIQELSSEDLEMKRKYLIDERNRCSIEATFNVQESCQFRQYIAALYALLSSLRSNMKNSSIFTEEFAEALSAFVVMINPITPHFSEELWSLLSTCPINPLRTEGRSIYNYSLQASDQPWPLADDDYPLLVKVRATNAKDLVAKIPISKDKLRTIDDAGITRMVESHLKSIGHRGIVKDVIQYKDLLAFATVSLTGKKKK